MSIRTKLMRPGYTAQASGAFSPPGRVLFATNIGSMGQDAVFHHLYEYGSISIFAVIGRIEKTTFIGAHARPEVRDALKVRWSFDERINDGFYFSKAVKLVQEIVEDPGRSVP